MKEGITNNFNAPIILNGGTLNGDIVNPTFNFADQKPDGRKAALQCMESHIRAQLAKDPFNRRLVLLPLVAAIRAELVPNVMKVAEFNESFNTDISPATFSEYVPREIGNSMISEEESAPYENEYRSLMRL